MANINSSLYTKQTGAITAKEQIGNVRGVVRSMYFTATGVAVQAINDTITLCRLPAGCRVVDYKINMADCGTTGIAKIGYAASASGTIVADDDAFGSGYAAKTAGALAVPAKDHAGLNLYLAEEVDVQMTWTEATDAGAVVNSGTIFFVQD